MVPEGETLETRSIRWTARHSAVREPSGMTSWNSVGLVTCEEDIDGDGLVGVSDVLALLSEFGTVCP